jgi:hypothetical protein
MDVVTTGDAEDISSTGRKGMPTISMQPKMVKIPRLNILGPSTILTSGGPQTPKE